MSDITKLIKSNYVMRNGEIALFDKVNEVIDAFNALPELPEPVVYKRSDITLESGFSNGGGSDSDWLQIEKNGDIICINGKVRYNQTIAAQNVKSIFKLPDDCRPLLNKTSSNLTATTTNRFYFIIANRSDGYIKVMAGDGGIPANTDILINITYCIGTLN